MALHVHNVTDAGNTMSYTQALQNIRQLAAFNNCCTLAERVKGAKRSPHLRIELRMSEFLQFEHHPEMVRACKKNTEGLPSISKMACGDRRSVSVCVFEIK